jgi:hypothetical protein
MTLNILKLYKSYFPFTSLYKNIPHVSCYNGTTGAKFPSNTLSLQKLGGLP